MNRATQRDRTEDPGGDWQSVGAGSIRSELLPGGDLVAAVLDRTVMSLADRGGASNLIGDRWADVAAAYAMTWPGQSRPNPENSSSPFLIERVARLDDIPQVAAAASRQGLQNPDLLIFGTANSEATIQAADAKFSVETARSKQVSPAVVEGLFTLGETLTSNLGDDVDGLEDSRIIPGVFLVPDFILTHLMMERRQGIVRTTVRWSEVVLVPVSAREFFGPMEGSEIMRLLADVDQIPASVDESLLAGLYYMRLARAAVGCWLDATKPLLAFQDRPDVDIAAVAAEAQQRRAGARSAFDLIVQWNDDVDVIRNQRSAVDHVAQLPITGKDLRTEIIRLASANDQVPPSSNQVRRRLGAWYRRELRERVGPLLPPIDDLPAALIEVGKAGAAIEPGLPAELERIVADLGARVAEQEVEGATVSASTKAAT